MRYRHFRQQIYRAMAVCALWISSGTALSHAAGATEPDDQYQRETRTCQDGRSRQDKSTCLTEARRAWDARKKGALATDTSAVFSNARKRCDVLSDPEKTACLARMDGRGTTSGSVAGGGILREVETVVKPSGVTSKTGTPEVADPEKLAPAKP